MRKLTIVFLLLCDLVLFAQTGVQISGRNIDSIKSDSLKNLVQGFEVIEYPFILNQIRDDEAIDVKLLNQLFNLEIDSTEIGLEEYYYGYVFFEEGYLGLVITHYYTPGAFGIENYFFELITLNYQGDVIDTKLLSCFCNDTNMGSNDYYSTEPEINFDSHKIIVKEKHTHATLVEEEGEESFENISYKEYLINIDANGIIAKKSNNE